MVGAIIDGVFTIEAHESVSTPALIGVIAVYARSSITARRRLTFVLFIANQSRRFATIYRNEKNNLETQKLKIHREATQKPHQLDCSDVLSRAGEEEDDDDDEGS